MAKKEEAPHTYSLDSTPAHPAHQHVKSLDNLQQDMLSALEYDQKKKQVNDAKLRAVAQHVEYDDFEKLVQGAHLKPVKPRSETLAAIGAQFDGFVMPKLEPKAAGPTLPKVAAATTDALPPAPKSSNEFLRAWRRQCKTPAQRYAYLRQIEPETLPLIFKTELDATIFDGIVGTLCERVLPSDSSAAEESGGAESSTDGSATRTDDLSFAATVLQYIGRINRFDLTLEFADTDTTKRLESLFDVLQRDAPSGNAALPPSLDPTALVALRGSYRV